MKRLHTRLLSVLMALVMAFSFSLTALAADENDKEEKEQQIEALEQEKEEQNQALNSMQTRQIRKQRLSLWIASWRVYRQRLIRPTLNWNRRRPPWSRRKRIWKLPGKKRKSSMRL